jgi:hypothetical protein
MTTTSFSNAKLGKKKTLSCIRLNTVNGLLKLAHTGSQNFTYRIRKKGRNQQKQSLTTLPMNTGVSYNSMSQ